MGGDREAEQSEMGGGGQEGQDPGLVGHEEVLGAWQRADYG